MPDVPLGWLADAAAMTDYYQSLSPIHEGIKDWYHSIHSVANNVGTTISFAALALAAGCVTGYFPWLLWFRVLYPPPPEGIPATVAAMSLPWLLMAGGSIFVLRWTLRWYAGKWPSRPRSTLSPEQLMFLDAMAAVLHLDQYMTSRRVEYLDDATAEARTALTGSTPLWRWDGDQLVADRSVVKASSSQMTIDTRRQPRTAGDVYLRSAWPNIVAGLRRALRERDRDMFTVTDPDIERIAKSAATIAPKVLRNLELRLNIRESKAVLSALASIAFVLATVDGPAGRERAEDGLRDLTIWIEALPMPDPGPAVQRQPAFADAVARLRAFGSAAWSWLPVRLVVEGLLTLGVLVGIALVLRQVALKAMDDNVIAMTVVPAAAVILVFVEGRRAAIFGGQPSNPRGPSSED